MKKIMVIVIIALFFFTIVPARADTVYGEIIKPAERDPTQWSDAKANDGTPFTFLLRANPANKKLIVFLEGGGFCDDEALSCLERWQEASGNMTTHPADDGDFIQASGGGILAHHVSKNPDFFDWNVAYGFYSSSDVWSGNETGTHSTSAGDIYFNGRANFRAMMEWLVQNIPIDDSDPDGEIFFVGTSAGGAGVMATSDIVAEMFPNMIDSGLVKILADGAFVTDFDNPDYRPGDSNDPIRKVMRAAHPFWVAQLNPLCEADYPSFKGKCYAAAIVDSYISDPSPDGLGIPIAIQASSIDRYMLDLHHIDDPSDPDDVVAMEEYRESSLDAFLGVEYLFSGGHKRYHTIVHKNGVLKGWEMGPPEGPADWEFVRHFYENGSPLQVIWGNP